MRLLITRAEPDASRVSALLEAMGHSVIRAPVATCHRLPVVWPEGPPSGLVFTSRQAPALVQRDELKHLPVFPIGAATAEAARDAGFTDVRANAEGERATLVASMSGPSTLWWCSGTHIQGNLVDEMQSVGITLKRISLYEMVMMRELPTQSLEALKNRAVDAVLLMSAKTTDRFLVLLKKHAIDAQWLPALCLSEAVAAPLRLKHWQTIRVAASPDWGALMAVLPLLNSC